MATPLAYQHLNKPLSKKVMVELNALDVRQLEIFQAQAQQAQTQANLNSKASQEDL